MPDLRFVGIPNTGIIVPGIMEIGGITISTTARTLALTQDLALSRMTTITTSQIIAQLERGQDGAPINRDDVVVRILEPHLDSDA